MTIGGTERKNCTLRMSLLLHLLLATLAAVLAEFKISRFKQRFEAETSGVTQITKEIVTERRGDLSGIQRPMESAYFHYKAYAINLTELKVAFRGDRRRTSTDPGRKLVRVESWTEGVDVEGRVETLERANRRYLCRVKISLDGGFCTGIGALETMPDNHLQWINLQCNCTSSRMQVDQNCPETGVKDAADHDLRMLILKNLDRDLTNIIESLTLESINTHLRKSSPIMDTGVVANQSKPVSTNRCLPRHYLNFNPEITAEDRPRDKADGDIAAANEMVDFALSYVSDMIKDQYNDSIAIPDIDETLRSRVLFVRVQFGTFSARSGRLKGLASISRQGDSRMTSQNSIVNIFTNLVFKSLQVVYGRYRARLVVVYGTGGRIQAGVQPLSMFVQIRANLSSLEFQLKQYKIKETGRLSVSLSGTNPLLDWLTSLVGTWLANAFKYQITDALQNKFGAYANEILNNFSKAGPPNF